jgi:hypothetical protein
MFLKGKEYKEYDLSIAESRCLNLMVESYLFRTNPVPMTNRLFKTLVEETKLQGDHIRTVTEMIKCL